MQNGESVFATTPLELVREGMTVIAAAGRRLGTVDRLQMGDPEGATTAGNEPSPGPGGLGPLWGSDIDGLGDVPDQLRAELRRVGFIRVDGPDLKGAERFIPGDRVAQVAGDTVRLRPAAD